MTCNNIIACPTLERGLVCCEHVNGEGSDMYNMFLVMCIPCFLYLLKRGWLQLLLGNQSVRESGMMDNIIH